LEASPSMGSPNATIDIGPTKKWLHVTRSQSCCYYFTVFLVPAVHLQLQSYVWRSPCQLLEKIATMRSSSVYCGGADLPVWRPCHTKFDCMCRNARFVAVFEDWCAYYGSASLVTYCSGYLCRSGLSTYGRGILEASSLEAMLSM